MQSILVSHSDIADIEEFDFETKLVIEHECSGLTLDNLRKTIEEVQIKNLVKTKIPKFNLQLHAFVYDKLINFPESYFVFDTITTDNFFRNVHRMLNFKVHLHHLHVTGKIFGYAHDFCNWKIRENKTEIPVLAHNFFSFDAFFFFKGYQERAWGTKDVSIGGNNLTHINYANINGEEVKCIDTLKYYQKSLAQLPSTLSDKKKGAVKKVTKQFLKQQDYFLEIWRYLGRSQKDKILNIIADGKGIIPYKKIVDMDSLFILPENDVFFEKTEFYSDLKQKAISASDYESSYYLYSTLKMRNIGDMNDLYNAPDVILLCEIIENRFQLMQKENGYNPRKCNLASTLSGYIEREMSKAIIALPASTEVVDIFEKILTGGFSCVNTRLAFDTEILLLNSNKNENDDVLQKDYRCKLCYKLKLDSDSEFKTSES